MTDDRTDDQTAAEPGVKTAAETENLAQAARAAALGSYSPYSKFRVGAVVVSAEGVRYGGCNVENAAYPSTICAEANAVTTAAADGVRRIDTVVVACIDADSAAVATPCGNCRQILREFGVRRVVATAGEGSGTIEFTLDELLPHSFTF